MYTAAELFNLATMADAKEVVKTMMKAPITEEFRKSIDPTSVKMSLSKQVKTWVKK